jgi:hypothetical protein
MEKRAVVQLLAEYYHVKDVTLEKLYKAYVASKATHPGLDLDPVFKILETSSPKGLIHSSADSLRQAMRSLYIELDQEKTSYSEKNKTYPTHLKRLLELLSSLLGTESACDQ